MLVTPTDLKIKWVDANVNSSNACDRTYPGSEPVVLALLVSGDVMRRISSVPAELVLLVGGDVDVLEVPLALLGLAGVALSLRTRERIGQGHEAG